MDSIRIRGARTHNLRNIDLDIPRDRLVVITGLSGSGKSSLAFDTLFAEGQRRYVESLSTYARQFLARLDKPDVDHIDGLSPAIAIEQKASSHNPRSTVGTVTEIHDHLRLLFARAGTPRCPQHDIALSAQTVSQMVDAVLALPEGKRLMLLAPVVRDRKGDHGRLFDEWRARGFIRARIDGELAELDPPPKLDGNLAHSIELVVDRFKVRSDLRLRLAESFETALKMADGNAIIADMDNSQAPPLVFSEHYACPQCGHTLVDLEPRLFSFNNPHGACAECSGLGVMAHFDPERVVIDADLSLAGGAIRGWDKRNAYYFQMVQSLGRHYDFSPEAPWRELPESIQQVILYGSGDTPIPFDYRFEGDTGKVRKHPFEGILPNMQRRYQETESAAVREELGRFRSEQPCPHCHGTRLNAAARSVFINSHTIAEASGWTLDRLLTWLTSLNLTGARAEVAAKVVDEASQRLGFLVDVGLDYLSLGRSANTLSGGEGQRIRLASQIGAGLVGVLYVLDEPSIGLHQRDNGRLLDTLKRLRDLGNSVIVVEHDAEAMWAADQLVDVGPGAGTHGGQIVAQGTPAQIAANPASLTGQYLAGQHQIRLGSERRQPDPDRWLRIRGARGNNLKQLTVGIPVGLMSCVTGVSGSGKSTLINDTLYPVAAAELHRAHSEPAPHDGIDGLEHFDHVVDIDQAAIGRTPRSNPATYTGLFAPLRELFASTPEARARGYKPGRFSFNVKGGRCEACQGDGLVRVEMHFLPDVYVPCDVCAGKRYNRETLDIRYRGLNIDEVLKLTIEDAAEQFSAVPTVSRKLQTLLAVGLGYLTLGQSATTLSGGEAQRVKLARELSKRDSGRSLYILDEPTTGLHFHDVQQLLQVLARLRERGNTIVIIEHNLDIIRNADWIIDLGPEGGGAGGECLVSGPPQTVAECERSYTGRFLAGQNAPTQVREA